MNTNRWEELEKVASPEVLAALKKFDAFYDGSKIADWAAGLYDPEIGGFYYSNSARDTEGYLPDIESTAQIFGLMIESGAIKNRNEDIPNHIKAKLVSFAKSLQSPEDGYFFHPQWPHGRENLQTDRYGRDLGNACSIIKNFRLNEDGEENVEQFPNYCAPNGVKCKKHFGTDECCPTVRLQTPKREDKTPEHRPDMPDYSSREAFSAWLEEYEKDIKKSSGHAHHLAALMTQIIAHGYGDIVLDLFDRVQAELFEEHIAAGIEPTGLWQTNIDYHIVWGLWKHVQYYNHKDIGRPFNLKYVPFMIKSCVKVLLLAPDGMYRMNDLFNQWVSIRSVIDNVRKYHGEEALGVIYDIVRDNATALIDNTLAKITPFAVEDGSIAYQSNGLSMKDIYGTPICVGAHEGDVNAVGLCISMHWAVFQCLGYTPIRLATHEDGKRFAEKLVNAKPIKKAPHPEAK